MITNIKELVTLVKSCADLEQSWQKMKIMQASPVVSEWFYTSYALKNKNKTQLQAFTDFYNDVTEGKYNENAI